MSVVAETLGVSRSNLHDRLKGSAKPRRRYHKAQAAAVVPLITALAAARPTYGYRRITALLNRQLRAAGTAPVNHRCASSERAPVIVADTATGAPIERSSARSCLGRRHHPFLNERLRMLRASIRLASGRRSRRAGREWSDRKVPRLSDVRMLASFGSREAPRWNMRAARLVFPERRTRFDPAFSTDPSRRRCRMFLSPGG